MNVTATELKARLGLYLEKTLKEPVIVEKSGRQTAVLISFEEYQKLTALEDYYWGELALQAKKEGVFQGDAMQEILNIAKQKGAVF